VLGVTLIVLVIAQQANDPSTLALERAARRALGREAVLRIEQLASDPQDDESEARAANADGVVELSWSADHTKARVHCYLRRDARWVDREISFGTGTAGAEREAVERGRLLGFAIATMFAEEQAEVSAAPAPAEQELAPKPTPKPTPQAKPKAPKPSAPSEPRTDRADSSAPDGTDGTDDTDAGAATSRSSRAPAMSVEFAGIASSGIEGTAAALGATAGMRRAFVGPLWGRLFISGRSGNIPRAQTSTRTAMFGGGLALAFVPTQRFELGLRLDAFASYFDATHLSEDDTTPDRRSRWVAGADTLLEGGVHLGGGTGLFLGAGLEAVLGRTEVYTHGTRVAVVPPFRAVAEFGLRTRF
jgi:hypothetical protein